MKRKRFRSVIGFLLSVAAVAVGTVHILLALRSGHEFNLYFGAMSLAFGAVMLWAERHHG